MVIEANAPGNMAFQSCFAFGLLQDWILSAMHALDAGMYLMWQSSMVSVEVFFCSSGLLSSQIGSSRPQAPSLEALLLMSTFRIRSEGAGPYLPAAARKD